MFLDEGITFSDIECCGLVLMAHEYIHVLQWQGRGADFAAEYIRRFRSGTGPGNTLEAPAYVWGLWMKHYFAYGARPPWKIFKPLPK